MGRSRDQRTHSWSSLHCVSEGPAFKLSVGLPLSNLNRFSKFLTAGKRIKFATRSLHNFPPRLDYVAALPWEVRSPNLLKISKHTAQTLHNTNSSSADRLEHACANCIVYIYHHYSLLLSPKLIVIYRPRENRRFSKSRQRKVKLK